MFYILERKVGKHFNQIGIVVADSIEEAAAKIEMKIKDAVQPPESKVAYANLENDFSLMEMPEIASPLSGPERKVFATMEVTTRKPSEEELRKTFGFTNPETDLDVVKANLARGLGVSIEKVEERLQETNGLQSIIHDMARIGKNRLRHIPL